MMESFSPGASGSGSLARQSVTKVSNQSVVRTIVDFMCAGFVGSRRSDLITQSVHLDPFIPFMSSSGIRSRDIWRKSSPPDWVGRISTASKGCSMWSGNRIIASPKGVRFTSSGKESHLEPTPPNKTPEGNIKSKVSIQDGYSIIMPEVESADKHMNAATSSVSVHR